MNDKNMIKRSLPVLPPVILWVLTMIFRPDRAFFDYGKDVDGKYWIIKVLFLILLIPAWLFICKVYRKIREGSSLYKRGFLYFLIYLALMLILLVFMWPGAWAWDDIWTLNSLQWYNFFCPWQNVITGIYYDLMMQFLPFPGGIILMQVIIISLCTAYVISGLEASFGPYREQKICPDVLVKLIPFILPPVLIYNFSGYRAALATHLELVLVVTLVRSVKDEKQWTVPELIYFGLLALIVSSWRTESFVYIFVVIVLLLWNRRIYNTGIRLVLAALILLSFIGVHKYQKSELGNSNYEIVSLLGQCGELVRNADEKANKEELEKIDRVVCVDIIKANPGADGTMLYFGLQAVRDDYTGEEYKDFTGSLVKLAMKYPSVLIKERWKTFINAMGIKGMNDNVGMTAGLFDEGSQGSEFFKSKDMIAPYPPFPVLRKKLVYALCCEKADGFPVLPLQVVIWNGLVPVLALIAAFIRLAIKKSWKYLFIVTLILCKLCIVILTQPAGTFMYIYPFYLMGYVLIVYRLFCRRIKA